MDKISRCVICDSYEFEKISRHIKFNVDSFIMRCVNCSFVFSSLQLNDLELSNFYANKYRLDKKEIFDRERELGDLERSMSQYDFIGKYINPKDSVLDIGAGYGVNANFLYSKGFKDITVLEFDDSSIREFVPAIKKKRGFLIDIEEKYDFIYLSHVLEHFYALKEKVRKVRKMLCKGGRVLIELPNLENMRVRNNLSNTYHHWFFLKDHLERLFKAFNFKFLKLSFFGKDCLFSELSDAQKMDVYKGIKSGKLDMVEIDAKHPNAFWMRALLQIL